MLAISAGSDKAYFGHILGVFFSGDFLALSTSGKPQGGKFRPGLRLLQGACTYRLRMPSSHVTDDTFKVNVHSLSFPLLTVTKNVLTIRDKSWTDQSLSSSSLGLSIGTP